MNEQEYKREGLSFKSWLQLIAGIVVVGIIATVLVLALPTIRALSPFLGIVLVVTLIVCVPCVPIFAGWYIADVRKDKRIQARRFAANANNVYSAYLDEANGRFIQPVNGQLPMVVPQHYAPTINEHHHNDVSQFAKMLELSQGTRVQEIANPGHVIGEIHIPTFRESLDLGLIGPGQKKMLLCHQVIQDENTELFTGIEPYQDELENNSTVFLGGASKSGKSTYMAHLAAQGALMNALYYIIDPHLTHAEKSVAKKLEALSHAFILPPARTEAEIWHVLNHAKSVAEARKDGKETPYGNRQIIFIVDEALAVLSQAHHTQNKEVILMYRDLALFLRDLGTQYAKFGVSGIIASQYVTKDAFKLPSPAGNIDFRDGCQNQILMRLPPNQAQAMRLIPAKELRGVRTLPQGHGYMGTYDGEVMRMASGNVSRQDIEYVASLAQAVPGQNKMYAVPDQYPISTRSVQGSTPVLEREIVDIAPSSVRSIPLRSHGTHISTGPLASTVKPLVVRSEQGTGTPVRAFKKRFTPEQEIQFLTLHRECKSIRTAIAKMHISYGDYQAYASWIVRTKSNGSV